MKKAILALAMAGILVASLAGCGAQPAATPQTVTVNGTGEVEAAPDIAILRLGVETKGATSEAARNANAEAVSATLEAVKELGVEEADVQTSGMYLRPTYNDAGNVNGYRMSVDMEITVRDITKAGEIIDAAIGSGSNTLDRVSYGISNENELYGQALEAAVKSARLSAEKLAAADGRTVGKMVSATEFGSGITVRANPETGGMNKAEATMAADTSVMAGTDTISAQVEVVFELQ